ncbi:OLC1v1028735C1 [Oldenlandia corymbosa var. corymbosa]|uniref:OLC1v1028735C1 n=1 Tax=Oldenlandia corymbosa var. corymbosa TaxID=529605 RepID=A0AAV1CE44_OLDCO|nr:OLC1v1028735C1 [Oldenlandia corymbosa var. corymbosa]
MPSSPTGKNPLLLPINHVISHLTFRGYVRCFSHLSSFFLVNHSGDTCEKSSDQKCTDLKRDPDLDLLLGKICVGRSEDEVYQFLMQDPGCNATKITHQLINKLLNRFTDDWRSALGVFRWVESHWAYKPLPEAYDKVVDILGKMKQMEKMLSFVEEMRRDRLVSLNTIAKVMRRFAGAGQWKDAILIFDELEKFGLKKNTESMNLLLDTLCKAKKVEQARDIFLKLKSHMPPNEHTFNIFIHGWCNINRVEEAHWTVQEMKGDGCRPSVISYSTIIQFYCHQYNFVRVYELLDDMKAQNCIPNVVTYTTIMHSLTKSNAFEESLKMAEKTKAVGCELDTLYFNVLLHTLGRADRVDEAIYNFKVEMPGRGIVPNVSTYNTMIALLCHHEQEEVALEFLGDMENSPYCKPDLQTYIPLLKSCFKAGKKDSCLNKLLHDMSNKHHLCFDLSTYALLIHGLCKANKAEDAYNLFLKMVAQDITPRYLTCRLLLEALRQNDMYVAVDRVEDFMKKMKSSRISTVF